MPDSSPYDVKHDPAARRFSVKVGDSLATAAYERTGNLIKFTHTLVPPESEGQGIATTLATSALGYARAEGLTVEPQCAFFARFMEKNPEYEDLRAR